MGMMQNPEVVVATAADFALLRGARLVATGLWTDVAAVRAWKRDEITTDQICVVLTLSGGGEFVVHEDVIGWEDFLEAAERALPGMRRFREWFPEVSQPALARNETRLFDRSRARGNAR